MITVLIVDDHPIVRQGVRAELSKTPDIRVIDEALNADEAMVKVRSCKPDLVLLDISLLLGRSSSAAKNTSFF